MPEFSYRRSIPVEEGQYHLVVAGGCTEAGCAAAICAGRLGAKVLLVEGQGCLGGTGTSGLVTEFDPTAGLASKRRVGGPKARKNHRNAHARAATCGVCSAPSAGGRRP